MCVAGAKALKKKEANTARGIIAKHIKEMQTPALPYAQAYSMRAFGVPSNATTFYSRNMPVAAAAAAPLRWQPMPKLLQ